MGPVSPLGGARVPTPRVIQRKRYQGSGTFANASMDPSQMRAFCALSPACESLMRAAFDALHLTARSYDRVLRVARTIADLAGSEEILPEHVAEAVQYRTYSFEDG